MQVLPFVVVVFDPYERCKQDYLHKRYMYDMMGRFIYILDSSNYTVVCRIVRRLLILVHKWQFKGMADTYEY